MEFFWLFSGNFCEVSTFYANVFLAPAFFKPIPGAIAGSETDVFWQTFSFFF